MEPHCVGLGHYITLYRLTFSSGFGADRERDALTRESETPNLGQWSAILARAIRKCSLVGEFLEHRVCQPSLSRRLSHPRFLS